MSQTEPDVTNLVPKMITAVEALLTATAKAGNAEVALHFSQSVAVLLSTKLGELISSRAISASLPPDRQR